MSALVTANWKTAMQPTKKGTRVYTRVQPNTGHEITVRKRQQQFIVFIDNTETQEFATQQAAMQAVDRMADAGASPSPSALPD